MLWYPWSEWEQLCLWCLQATVASGLWDVISALPMAAVPGAPSEQWFAQVALAVAADGMAGAGHRSCRSVLIFFPGAPVPSPELCPVKVERSMILALHTIPYPGKFSFSGVSVILPAQSATSTHSTHQLPYCSQLQLVVCLETISSCCRGNWL